MNNTITIVGHVGQPPSVKKFTSGKKVVKFSVAVKEFSADKEPQTMWLDVQAWNGLGDRAYEHITKGREVVIQGRLALDSYKDKDGRDVTKPVINLNSFFLCGKKPVSAELPKTSLILWNLQKISKYLKPKNK